MGHLDQTLSSDDKITKEIEKLSLDSDTLLADYDLWLRLFRYIMLNI